MFNEILTTNSCLIVLSMFSLAWFIVGLSAGKRLAPAPKKSPRPQSGGKKRKKEASELYVGNLSYEVNAKELRRVFEKHGNVRSVRIIENRFTGKSKGFAFVEMAGATDAQTAIKTLNGEELDGRKLVVNFARTRPKD